MEVIAHCADGEAGSGDYTVEQGGLVEPGGRGSGAGLPLIPGLRLAPGRPGQSDGLAGGGGGGVTVNGYPVRKHSTNVGEGFGGGGGGSELIGNGGVVIIYTL